MRTPVKLSVYGLSLAVVFTGAWAVGSAVGPFDASTPTGDGHHAARADGRDDAALSTTVAPPRPIDPVSQQQPPLATGIPTAMATPPAVTAPSVPAARLQPAGAQGVPAPPQGQSGKPPEPITVREPAEERNGPYARRMERGGRHVGQGNGADHDRQGHQQERRGEGHR